MFLVCLSFLCLCLHVSIKQGEDIRILTLGNNSIFYGIHLYCSEAVSILMQGLFHDHVKRQLLWKCWDVFFNDIEGNYDATLTLIRYGLQLSSSILRLYALHVAHIDTQPCKLAGILFIWTSHIIVLLLYRHRTHSH